ncbi:ACT domain-containing protein [Micromonospora echinofusca]|uniref:ACT domain-containing protein n=1 Tax=Micromonospora echinofusca TaxID=47858 RepID=A0ABS3VU08_MICEH|nr:ACT domain-containing protein [Micromonospora echinofusca]MBO4208027.1 ACT domain-containing protein [Micromonospora echinofusca]
MLDIALLPDEYAVCRIPSGTPVPTGLLSDLSGTEVASLAASPDGLSLICPAGRVPEGATVETPWRCLRVVGPLDLALTGVLASLVTPLAEARVEILAFSTYDTDYVLVPTVRLAEAIGTLTNVGHRVAT